MAVRGVELTDMGRVAKEELRDAVDSPSAAGVDPDVLWKALGEHAGPESPLANAIGREKNGLSDRGMLRSGVAAQLARKLAAEHGLGWDDSTRAFVAEYLLPPQLDAEQRALLDVAAELFVETGEWPHVRTVIRQAIRDRGLSVAAESLWSLPQSVGHSDGQTMVLTAEGLAVTNSATSVLEALLALARAAADAYLSDEEEPKVATGNVVRPLDLGEGTLAQLNVLLTTERFFLGSGHSDSGNWVYEVTANAAELQDCRTIGDYLLIRRRFTRPVAATAPVRDAAAQPDRKTRTRLTLEGMHEEVLASASGLYADGHYSQAIFEALKALEVRVREQSRIDESGRDLMTKAFNGDPLPVDLRHAGGRSGDDEQEGFRFLFMGAIQGIRNPKGHDLVTQDDPERALEYLGLASLLFRRLDDARERARSVSPG